MKAILCKSYGPPENLVLEEVDDLKPGEGEACFGGTTDFAANGDPDETSLSDATGCKKALRAGAGIPGRTAWS